MELLINSFKIFGFMLLLLTGAFLVFFGKECIVYSGKTMDDIQGYTSILSGMFLISISFAILFTYILSF